MHHKDDIKTARDMYNVNHVGNYNNVLIYINVIRVIIGLNTDSKMKKFPPLDIALIPETNLEWLKSLKEHKSNKQNFCNLLKTSEKFDETPSRRLN